jgi:uncharacterized protein
VSRIRSEGPLTIRDIDDDVLVEKEHLWASRKPSKRALEHVGHAKRTTLPDGTERLEPSPIRRPFAIAAAQ